MFLFVLNNTASPTPAPVSNPDIMLAADITFSRYIFVKITDAAQFGIRPIRLATIGPKIFWFNSKLAIFSSPIKYTAVFMMNVIIIININIFMVCFSADFKMLPSSQWQWSSSHRCSISISFSSSVFSCFFLCIILITKSIANPAIIPITNFIANIFIIIIGETASEISIGIISSEVVK